MTTDNVEKLTLAFSAEDREFLREQGNTDEQINAFLAQATAEKRTQEELDAQIADIRENVVKAKAEREAFEAQQKAAERAQRRDAFAGMAMQGLLANPDMGFEAISQIARAAVANADGLLKALDAAEATD